MYWIIKLCIVLVALFAISRAFLRFKDKKISRQGLLFWTILWTLAVVFAFAPHGVSYFADLVGIKRGTDFVAYLSIILLFYMIFRIYVKFESLEQNISTLTRELAIRGFKKGNGKNRMAD
ncbi:DUF2304 family protein [Candidatus Woesearchaeota archaeon]|nr:DUF2304 family protein [Candidatus Woesearchaeota archaeon]